MSLIRWDRAVILGRAPGHPWGVIRLEGAAFTTVVDLPPPPAPGPDGIIYEGRVRAHVTANLHGDFASWSMVDRFPDAIRVAAHVLDAAEGRHMFPLRGVDGA